MDPNQIVIEFLHWLGAACLLCSFIVRMLPKPDDAAVKLQLKSIPRWYLIAYNILRWASVNAGWKADRKQ